MTHRHTRRKGFTLVELLVVIGIIAVLAAILLPVYMNSRKKAREVNCLSNLHDIAVAIKLAHQDYKRYPDEPVLNGNVWQGGVSALYPDYLEAKESLVCPAGKDQVVPGQEGYSSYNFYDANGDGSPDALVYNRWGFFEASDPDGDGLGTPGVTNVSDGVPYGCTGDWNPNLIQVWKNQYGYSKAKWPALANPNAPGNTIICVCRFHEKDRKGQDRPVLTIRVNGSGKALRLSEADFIGQSE